MPRKVKNGWLVLAVSAAAAMMLAGAPAPAAAQQTLSICIHPNGRISGVNTACTARDTMLGPWVAVGPAGATGPSGVTGPAGPTGAPGVPGARGPNGATGPVGPQGAPGIAGAAGPSGAQGPVGPQGPTGATGDVGPIGSIGAQGPQGLAGPQGSTGGIGPTGPTGAQGAIGEEGPASLVVGPEGPQGPTGDAGTGGTPGPAGPVGPTGPAGTAGGLNTVLLTGGTLGAEIGPYYSPGAGLALNFTNYAGFGNGGEVNSPIVARTAVPIPAAGAGGTLFNLKVNLDAAPACSAGNCYSFELYDLTSATTVPMCSVGPAQTSCTSPFNATFELAVAASDAVALESIPGTGTAKPTVAPNMSYSVQYIHN
ncbi:MAG: BclA C-terminal domain-containing protein [Candidatus Binataceae bacterium]